MQGNRVAWRPVTRGSPVARERETVGMAGMESGPQVKKQLEGSRRGTWGGGRRGSTELSSRKLSNQKRQRGSYFLSSYCLNILRAIVVFGGVCREEEWGCLMSG